MSSTIDQVLLRSETNDQFVKALMSSLVLANRSSQQLPKPNDFAYFSSISTFEKQANKSNDHIRDLFGDVLKFVQKGEDFTLPDDLLDPTLFGNVVDVIDKLLVDTDILLDGENNSKQLFSNVNLSLAVDKDRLLRSSILPMRKPQEEYGFLGTIDNCRTRPFKPRLIKYPGGSRDIEPLSRVVADGEVAEVVAPSTYFPQPYQEVIEHLDYPLWQLQDPSLSSRPLTDVTSLERPVMFIKTEEALRAVIEELLRHDEIAVDLEHHSFRSFQGFTCLMQLSTRHKDYILDTLMLWPHMNLLNPVMTNQNILKVFHGCESDILWLQRDFGIYVVNCFDTYHAMKLLRYPAFSLAHLLKIHCHVTLNKKHQLSDWRQRPIPQEMLEYARLDTHYLLRAHDCLRTEIWKQYKGDGLRQVLDASRKVCTGRYEKEFFWPLGYRKLLNGPHVGSPTAAGLPVSNDSVMGALWSWRDLFARDNDESPSYVMSNAELIRIGLKLPTSVADLQAHCGPLSECARANMDKIIAVVKEQLNIGGSCMQSPSAKAYSSSAAGAGTGRLYGRALRTPSKDMAAYRDRPDESSSDTASVLWYQPNNAATGVMFVPSVDNNSDKTAAALSPLILADDLFKIAGWSEASEDTAGPRTGFHSVRKEEVSSELMDRLACVTAKITDKVPKFQFVTPVSVESSTLPQQQQQLTQAELDFMEPEVGLPSSLKEIYKISNDNRRQSKSKKREKCTAAAPSNLATDTAAALLRSSSDPQTMGATLFDENIYYAHAAAGQAALTAGPGDLEMSIDNTLAFAETLGWVASEASRQQLRTAHLADLAAHADASANNSVSSSQESQTLTEVLSAVNSKGGSVEGETTSTRSLASSANFSNSGTSNKKKAMDKVVDQDNSSRLTATEAKLLGLQSGQIPSKPQFDYSRSAHAVIGALGSAAAAQDEQGKPSSAAVKNPYVFGTTQASKAPSDRTHSNRYNQGSNKKR